MSNVSDPARFASAVIPSDSTVLSPTRGLYIGTTGDISVVMAEKQNTVVFTTVPVGVLPVQVTKVLAATTAGNIVALW